MSWFRLSQHFFAIPNLIAPKLDAFIFHTGTLNSSMCCPLSFLVGYKGGAQVDALEVQAQVDNIDWRVENCPVTKGGRKGCVYPPKFGGIPRSTDHSAYTPYSSFGL
jgi:hypothetical protein